MPECDRALAELDAANHRWARTDVPERIAVLEAAKDSLMAVAEHWGRSLRLD